MSVSVTFRGNLADAAYQLRETRFAESLLNGVVSSAGFVAILEVHLGSGFWCNHAGQVRPYDVADATYGWEYTGRRRIVPRVRVGCGLIGIPEEGELS